MQKAGRNDPCPCGSGKKFKKCCEAKTKQFSAQPIQEEAQVRKAASLTNLFQSRFSTPSEDGKA